MYSKNGTFYTEDHSISFGKVENNSFIEIANTWTTWHLIPSSRPTMAYPSATIKFVDFPGSDFPVDQTELITEDIQYGLCTGSFSFIVDNGHENWEKIRMSIVQVLHGKNLAMRLMDDPDYYYEGYFTVGNYESGAVHSSISISYQVNSFKKLIASG